MTEKDLSPEEQSMLALHDLILGAFRERFGEAIIGVNLMPLVSECWITVLVKRKTPEIEDLANEIEQKFLEEYGKSLAFNIKQPSRARVSGLIGKVFGKT